MARKKGMQFIPYDYEAAYNKALEDMSNMNYSHAILFTISLNLRTTGSSV